MKLLELDADASKKTESRREGDVVWQIFWL